jgi:sensor histidine kinase YesM
VSAAGGGVAITALLVLLLSFYLRLTTDYQHEQQRRQAEERQREALEKQHLAAELSLLKAQLNPHFLFNTLNNIYSLTSEASPDAPAAVAVLQLAELMRYQLYESAAATVPLAQEVAHLHSFLNLQRLRLPTADALQFCVPAELPAHYVLAPMLLLPLVENACKHGDLAQRPHAVELTLRLHEQCLTFTVRNGIRRAVQPTPAGPGGVGLTNLRRRLLLLYPQRHELRVDASATHYQVTLTLQLDSLEV